MKNIIVFASGYGTVFKAIADHFAKSDFARIRCLVYNNATAYVMIRARGMSIERLFITHYTLYESEILIELLDRKETDLIVLAGFTWLIPEHLINAFPKKIINIHPALLPKYGGKGMYGMRVHEAVVANKEPYTGITIHYVNPQYDEGEIIFQAKCPVLSTDTAEDVAEKVHELEYEHYPKVIEQLLRKKK